MTTETWSDGASGLKCHSVADLFDWEGRGDGHGDLAREDRVGDPPKVVRAGILATGGADAAGGVGAVNRRHTTTTTAVDCTED
jgi:hypothetical protein